MRVGLLYTAIFGLGLISLLAMISSIPSPEHLILGEWEELTWEYEIVDKYDNEPDRLKHIPDELKSSIGENLIIHKAETWTFYPDGRLKLSGKDIDKTVTWRIKGRGHILQLKHDDNMIEHYILSVLDSDNMYLNFDTDIQARGIAKLTFKRIN